MDGDCGDLAEFVEKNATPIMQTPIIKTQTQISLWWWKIISVFMATNFNIWKYCMNYMLCQPESAKNPEIYRTYQVF